MQIFVSVWNFFSHAFRDIFCPAFVLAFCCTRLPGCFCFPKRKLQLLKARYRPGQWRIQKFWSGGGAEGNLSAPSSFIANVHNEIMPFTRKKRLFEKNMSQLGGSRPTPPPLWIHYWAWPYCAESAVKLQSINHVVITHFIATINSSWKKDVQCMRWWTDTAGGGHFSAYYCVIKLVVRH